VRNHSVTKIFIHCILQPGTDAAEVAADLRTFLQNTDGIQPVMVKAEQPHVGLAEVLAIVQLSSAAIDLTGKLIDFIKSRQDKSKVKDIEIEIDGERVPAGSLTPEQRTRLAAAISQGTGTGT
jgi:hypothetical protein